VSAPQRAIEVVSDLDARWPEIAPLLHALHRHHEPLVGRRLLPDWEARQREQVGALLATGDHRVLLARFEGAVVGFANGSVRRDPAVMVETFGAIDNVFVVPDQRGTGVARLLVDALETWFLAQGAAEAQLSVVAANTDAVEAWRALGFEPLAHRMRKSLD
jgi:GNAT superfamily N-acetyltransferase